MEVVEDSILVFIEGYLQQAMVKNLEVFGPKPC